MWYDLVGAGVWYRTSFLKHGFVLAVGLTGVACTSVLGLDGLAYDRHLDAGAAGGSAGQGGSAGSGTGGASGTAGASGAAGLAGAAGTAGSGGVSGSAGAAGTGSGGPSCAGLASNCGKSNDDSCCASLPVPAGTFLMGRETDDCSDYPNGCVEGCPAAATCNADEQPEHSVQVNALSLDKYEVTVGRFRKFVEAYPASKPAAGAGTIAGIAGSGWQSAWEVKLPTDQAGLVFDLQQCAGHTYTSTSGSGDARAVNCVTWFEAFAFCVWDGGRLPTEAEWEYAAAGGDENRLFPWGSVVATCEYANASGCGNTVDHVVGTRGAGVGRWGHYDLVGNVAEWTLDWYANDWYSDAAATGANVANLTPSAGHVTRGGWYFTKQVDLRVTARATEGAQRSGLRCARAP